jgi:type II secretory pathway pseudopilin PulG
MNYFNSTQRSDQRIEGQFVSGRFGFTLIEMLISVSLVLLMMVMFAEIFSLASNSMTLQQAIADNDQQARAFTTVLREDLHKRTVRTMTPFDPGEDPDLQVIPFSERSGYFYLSMNDPANAIDNVLQFTVRSTIKLESGDETPYYGRAVGLVSLDPLVGVATAAQHVRSNPQQPEHDDGELELNATAASTAAEITYFVRGGRLYRRVVLLRDPLPVSGGSRTQPRMTWDNVGNNREPEPIEYFRRNLSLTQPTRLQTTAAGEYGRYDSTTGAFLSDDYWNDFDLAATQAIFVDAMGAQFPDGAYVLLARALDNELPASESLGNPRQRFGFDQFNGLSREFSHSDPAAAGFFFLGRYTLEEMSHPDFNFPQAASVLGNSPLSYVDVPALADAIPAFEPDGAVDTFAGGPRRGEDVLLSNVHAFEIEIWDDRVGQFLPLGHSQLDAGGNAGDYHRARYQPTTSGVDIVPGDVTQWVANTPDWTRRVFDTWHPRYDHDGDAEVDANGNGMVDPAEDPNMNGVFDRNDDRAPYRALTYYPPTAAIGPYASRGQWQASTAMTPVTYAVGDIVFPLGEAPLDYSLYYRCVAAGTADTTEPIWSLHHGGIVEPRPTTTTGVPEPRWQAFRNVRPLRAIRLQVRFLHVASGKMRQLSLVHSLVD